MCKKVGIVNPSWSFCVRKYPDHVLKLYFVTKVPVCQTLTCIHKSDYGNTLWHHISFEVALSVN